MTARELLDADGWIDWDTEGWLVFVRGPFAGDRLGSVGGERLGRLASRETTPESTRDVLDAYVSVSRPSPDDRATRVRKHARQRRSG